MTVRMHPSPTHLPTSAYTESSVSISTSVIITRSKTSTVSLMENTTSADTPTTYTPTDPPCTGLLHTFVLFIVVTDIHPGNPASRPGVGLYLNGIQHFNNSIISFEQIGEDRCALLCYTNLNECCYMPKLGEWYSPNGSALRKKNSNDDLYRDRSDSVVRLHRRNNTLMPVGVFCCEIPFSFNGITRNRTYCIGVYNREDGKKDHDHYNN